MKKHLLIAALLASAVAVSATQATGALSVVEAAAKSTNQAAEKTEDKVKADNEIASANKEEVEARRQALEQKMAERKAAIVEKLSGKRQEKCEERETTINSVLDQRVATAQRYFDKFSAIQTKLVAFATEKQLDIDNANALELVMNDSATAAQAAIQAIGTTDFTCETAAAAAPGALVRDEVAAAKQALKDYRTAIKDYAAALKASASQPETTDTVTEETNE